MVHLRPKRICHATTPPPPGRVLIQGAVTEPAQPQRLRAHNANWILFWMCVLVTVNQLGFGGVVPTLPLYAQSFGVSMSAIGMAIAVYGLARFAGAIPAAWLSDAFGRRWALVLGGAVTSAGNLWCALAHNYPEFIVAR
ncbi:MAG: MFS transporter, partial [Proteobacteria bacterium]|nr:MFS transporter [Pseudomonadota bacterium]